MVVKTRKSNAKEQSSEKDRSPSVSVKSRRGKDGKSSAIQSKNGLFSELIRNKLGLSPSAFARGVTVLILAVIVGFLHWYHLSHLFENDRHFSHMSSLEKEMAFRTEMGLYYSYFKTIIKAPSFMSGLYMIMNDRLTEYPLEINTLKRFNVYPEVFLASCYRVYSSSMDFFGIPTKMCWTINRGEGLEPVESCEGLGDPAYFYVTFVFLLNGAMMSLFFIYGTFLSGSRLGGTATVLCFFFNHGESTRVMWTPPLRESFSYPFLVLQMLLVTYILRTKNPSRNTMMALVISNIFFMLPWQFAQFILLTQVASLFASYILGYLSPAKMQSLLVTHMISLAVCFLLMFGNSMLLTSFYASSLVSIWAHINSLIKSKFTNYKDFDTMMYTCAAEFDFIEADTLFRYIKTLLLPVNVLIVGFIAGRTIRDVMFLRNGETNKCEDDETEQTQVMANGVLVYHSLQLVAFAVLAVLIMRLKLFLTPHMCIMSCLICSRQLFGWIGQKFKLQIIVVAILSMMAIQGVANLQSQWGIIGEFSNLPQEELLEWIKDNSSLNAVFAGAMPTMASVKLSTSRAIVNHPHYEDAGLRERTKMVYAMYSRKPAEEVKRNLIKLQVDYFILEDSWCTRRSKPGCSMPEIWDVEDTQNAGKVPLCTLMSKDSRPHFSTVFNNSIYKVLRVPKIVKDIR
ncbi:probable C-mannosyltransferase DPY19L1 isoform X2 [Xyrauchen texanus]|uniref:probable C-mannosyltransferase DPY19L1 isoform X2 n=1 Tax=Xyrauchen texanus TaxID=154827 RepID=UPI0022425122|nr:probable C-mannosyltransferase DPY19L1 isoform X2 [Xyrauchen texanus]